MTTATIIPDLTNPAPSRSNVEDFSVDADQFLKDLPAIVDAENTIAQELNSWAIEVETFKNQAAISETNTVSSASTALTQARNAAASMVSLWVSGATYAVGQIVYSNVDGREYKRIAAGAGTTDPSSDPSNWESLGWEYITNYPSIKPTLNLDFANTKILDPRITFTRASEARYYDASTVALAEQNLLLQSQTFDNASWSKTNVTVSADATSAPDGTTTADKLVETSATGQHRAIQVPVLAAATSYTTSVYVKAAERGFAFLMANTDQQAISVNLTTGAVTTAAGTPANVSSVNAGGGWWRISFTFTGLGIAANQGVLVSSDGVWANRSYAGDGTSGIYVWGAQLEQRSTVTAYTPTTTAAVTNYIPVLQTAANGAPRFDHNPVTRESLGLLIEEQRTNLLTYSEQFDNAAWIKFQANITANAVIAPDGTLSADKLIGSSGTTAEHTVKQSTSFTSGQPYSYSFYAKAGELTTLRFWVSTNVLTGGANAIFNLSTGTYSSTSGGATYSCVAVGNGWHRLTVSFTATATTTTSSSIHIDLGAVTGDGYSGIYIWGAQIEAGAFATSYIPTVASQVTRSADAASMTGTNFSSWYRQDEGTLFSDFTSNANFASAPRIGMTVSDGTTSNRIRSYVNSSATVLQTQLTSAGASATLNNTVTASVGAVNKLAVAYKVNDFASSANAGVAATATGQVPQNINQAVIGVDLSSTGYINGTIKKIAYYPMRLANATLQVITQQ